MSHNDFSSYFFSEYFTFFFQTLRGHWHFQIELWIWYLSLKFLPYRTMSGISGCNFFIKAVARCRFPPATILLFILLRIIREDSYRTFQLPQLRHNSTLKWDIPQWCRDYILILKFLSVSCDVQFVCVQVIVKSYSAVKILFASSLVFGVLHAFRLYIKWPWVSIQWHNNYIFKWKVPQNPWVLQSV